MTRIVIIGGGPAGYEAALVAAQLGADVTVVDRDGIGGACVLDRLRPAQDAHRHRSDAGHSSAPRPGPRPAPPTATRWASTCPRSTRRITSARAGRSRPTSRARVEREGVRIIRGTAAFADEPSARGLHAVEARDARRRARDRSRPTSCWSPPAPRPRVLDDAEPDGERILSWRELYDLTELPEHLVVVGSGVTGAEFASRRTARWACRSRWCPAATGCCPARTPTRPRCCEEVFTERGVEILAQARAESVRRDGDGVVVELADGRTVERLARADDASGRCPTPPTSALEKVGVELGARRVHRRSTGCRARPCRASTRPATAPAC